MAIQNTTRQRSGHLLRMSVILAMIAAPAFAAPVVLCHASNSRVTHYIPSANTPDYVGQPSAAINPPALATLVATVPQLYWMCVGSPGAWTDVREMTAQEKSDLATANTAAGLTSHRNTAKAEFDGDAGEALRALVKVLLDELNILRASYPLPVASITRSGTTATVTTRWAHNLTGTPQVTIHGADVAAYNGTKTVTVTNGTTFTYTVAGSPATPAAGSLLAFPVDAAMNPRTLAQAKTAIQSAIDAGTVAE